ncbi:FAD/NAD(P)-binding protein [Streptomyces sp. Marseille-Q5077]|uniref:FAD/NAD(P)-binding protein n=1 Tax=Streptomyces sp. Marseille-Q5077 TaxID=3418995 RepID=UPI003D06EC4F
MTPPWRIAVVGSGPRGLMVTERLAARLAQEPAQRPMELYVIDEVEVGCGRIYRTDQPEWFLMNTPVGLITAFSGAPDDGPVRAGAGPSFAQWWSAGPPGYPGPEGYAPRAVYGRYLRFTLDAITDGLPPHVRLLRVNESVVDLSPTASGYRLTLANGTELEPNRVVLVTGHQRPPEDVPRSELAEFAARRPGLRHIRGDSPAEMPLDAIPAGATVGVLGLGLSFFDVMAACTIGRGGRFVEGADGEQVYRPSGAEPVLVGGSRSGLPLLAKGENNRPPGSGFRPSLFTPQQVRSRADGQVLDFSADVLPRLAAEVDLVYYATALRLSEGESAASVFTDEVIRSDNGSVPDVRAVAARHGLAELPAIDLEALARPFTGLVFNDPKEFDDQLVEVLRDSVREAERGNMASPLMAALDVIRDTRWVVRECVDFGSLHPASHRDDFLDRFIPSSSVLVAGPPPVRVRQLLALMAKGLLRVVGPEVRIAPDPESGRFIMSSPRVAGSDTPVDIVVDARVPGTALARDPAPLTRSLRAHGLWTEFVNRDAHDTFETGGVAVTRAPFHPLGRGGLPDTGLYVLGIPTENTRWFTQVGFARPGPWGDFIRDADAVAAHALGEAERAG